MRSLLTFMLLAAAMLPALSQANICDRTPQVRDEIMGQFGANDCAAVDAAALVARGIILLNLVAKQLTTLQAGDFAGLTSLDRLYLTCKKTD